MDKQNEAFALNGRNGGFGEPLTFPPGDIAKVLAPTTKLTKQSKRKGEEPRRDLTASSHPSKPAAKKRKTATIVKKEQGEEEQGEAGRLKVGQRIRAYWRDHKQWFQGRIIDEKTNQGGQRKVKVAYDDGDFVWHFPKHIQIEAIAESTSRTKQTARRQTARVLKPQLPWRVKVWWTDDQEYYEGTVTNQRPANDGSKDLYIEYDDGDKKWHNTKLTTIVELTQDTSGGRKVSSHVPHALSSLPCLIIIPFGYNWC